MTIVYQVSFVPSKWTYREEMTIGLANPLRYFGIYLDGKVMMATTQDENCAKMICLSLELTSSYIWGDGSATRELLAQLSKLRN